MLFYCIFIDIKLNIKIILKVFLLKILRGDYTKMKIMPILQLVVSVLLIIVILLQNKEGGLGVIGGSASGSYHTKRGFEKFLSQSTIILSVFFIIISLLVIIK